MTLQNVDILDQFSERIPRRIIIIPLGRPTPHPGRTSGKTKDMLLEQVVIYFPPGNPLTAGARDGIAELAQRLNTPRIHTYKFPDRFP